MATTLPTGTEQLLLELFVIFVTTKMLGEIFERLTAIGQHPHLGSRGGER